MVSTLKSGNTSLPKDSSFNIITPKIGSIASPTNSNQVFDSWWR